LPRGRTDVAAAQDRRRAAAAAWRGAGDGLARAWGTHDHFGKAITYLAAHGAKTVTWIAEAFADEHRAALSWCNDNTPEDIAFYAVAPKLMWTAESPPGLMFALVVGPNSFVKKAKQVEQRTEGPLSAVCGAFWSALDKAIAADAGLATHARRYGGRLSSEWILPSVDTAWLEDEPRVLAYVSLPE
jgi:hypothetical protein